MEKYIYPGSCILPYVLISKIGIGAYSQVWLVCEVNTDLFYALKIMKHGHLDEANRELMLNDDITTVTKDAKSFPLNIYLRSFTFTPKTNKKKNHLCLLSYLMQGSSITVMNIKYPGGYPLNLIKCIANNTLLALKILHKKGIIHTDIKPENILIDGESAIHKKCIDTFNSINAWNTYNKYKKSIKKFTKIISKKLKLALPIINLDEDCELDASDEGSYEYPPLLFNEYDKINDRSQSCSDYDDNVFVRAHDAMPKDLNDYYNYNKTKPRDYTKVDGSLLCKVADFGTSYYKNDLPLDEIQTRHYRAPECILNCRELYSGCMDIWSLGCVIMELLTGAVLFIPKEAPLTADIHHLFLIERFCGKIPDNIINMSPRKDFLYNHDCTLLNVAKFDCIGLKEIMGLRGLDEYTIEKIYPLLFHMLDPNPMTRGHVNGLLEIVKTL